MEKNYKELLLEEIKNIDDETILRFVYIFIKGLKDNKQ